MGSGASWAFVSHPARSTRGLSVGWRCVRRGRLKRRKGAKIASSPRVKTDALGPRFEGLARGWRATAQSLESLELLLVSVVPPPPLVSLLQSIPSLEVEVLDEEVSLVLVLPLQSSEDEVSLVVESAVLPLQSSEEDVSLVVESAVLPLQSSEDEVSPVVESVVLPSQSSDVELS